MFDHRRAGLKTCASITASCPARQVLLRSPWARASGRPGEILDICHEKNLTASDEFPTAPGPLHA